MATIIPPEKLFGKDDVPNTGGSFRPVTVITGSVPVVRYARGIDEAMGRLPALDRSLSKSD